MVKTVVDWSAEMYIDNDTKTNMISRRNPELKQGYIHSDRNNVIFHKYTNLQQKFKLVDEGDQSDDLTVPARNSAVQEQSQKHH